MSGPGVARLGQTLCLTGAGLAGIGLVGWLADIPALTTIVPGQPVMAPNTAVALLLVGVAGALRHRDPSDRIAVWVSRVVGVIVLVLGVASIAEYVFGHDLGIQDVMIERGDITARTSPPTAVAFTLVAAALLVFDLWRGRWAEWLLLGAALIAIAALTAMLVGAARLYRIEARPMIGVALFTATSLLLTSVGALLARPDAPFMRVATSPRPGSVALRRLAVPTVLGPVLLAFVIGRLFDAGWIPDLEIAIAMLAIAMAVIGLVVIAANAVPLNRADAIQQRRVDEQRFLAGLGTALQASLERTATIERVTGLVAEFLGATCRIEDATADDDHVRAVAATKRSLVVGGAAPALFVPLIARDRLVAVLVVSSSTPDRTYTVDDVRLVEDVARRAALAIDNAELYEAARDASRSRDRVLGIVAHDLRNPLNAIVMRAAALRVPVDDRERQSHKAADGIERAAHRMSRLIQDLLDVTRIEAGRLSIDRTPIRTAQVVSDVVEAQTPLATSASLELRVDLAPALPDVCADRDRLQQVLENLIANALKFTAAGGRITVGAEARGRDVEFRVADTGEGIATEDVAHVFDRFWQARDGTLHGAGLGLPIVKGLVEAHGGRIWVESERGVGTTFFFTIPTAPSP